MGISISLQTKLTDKRFTKFQLQVNQTAAPLVPITWTQLLKDGIFISKTSLQTL